MNQKIKTLGLRCPDEKWETVAFPNTPPNEFVIEGKPVVRHLVTFQDEEKGFYTGLWECSAGKVHMTQPADEYETCYVISGKVIVENEHEEKRELTVGDSFTLAPLWAADCEFQGDFAMIYTAIKC